MSKLSKLEESLRQMEAIAPRAGFLEELKEIATLPRRQMGAEIFEKQRKYKIRIRWLLTSSACLVTIAICIALLAPSNYSVGSTFIALQKIRSFHVAGRI